MNRTPFRALIAIVAAAALALTGASAAHAAGSTATLSGHVALEGGGALPSEVNAYIRVCPTAGGDCLIAGASHPSGYYLLAVDEGIEYTICLDGGFATDLISECWSEGAPFTFGVGDQASMDWDVVIGGHLSGTVSYYSPTLGALDGANGTQVALYRLNQGEDLFEFYDQTEVPPGYPAFVFYALPPGTYAVQFLATSVFENEVALNSEYWENARYWAERTDLVVTPAAQIDLGDVTLAPRSLDVSRIQGEDRFDVGVNITQAMYPLGTVPAEGIPVVYIANGFNFPDALAAGPAAALRGGAVLLVQPTVLPAAVATELTRLRPQKIVVAGGPASVSSAVFEQLKGFVPTPSDVTRAGGADRYEAARSVVSGAFGAVGADMAIIATGGNFPDALSAGPAAASQSGPVILVNGSAGSIDSATAQLITDLGIQQVYIAGGTGSVSAGIETSLKSLLGDTAVVRFAGEDRFDVGVLISQQFFSDAEYTFVATGYKFPDALTGGPLAAALGGPLYLSRPECLPPSVGFDILDVNAQAVVLLGGPGSLSTAVEDLTLC